METKAEYTTPADGVLSLLNYMTSAQVNALTEALAMVRNNGNGYGQVRLVLEHGQCSFVAAEVSVKLPKG